MSDIPCKNCITFAVCNAQIADDFPHLDVIYKLIPKCSLIREYTKSPSSELVLKVAKFFNPQGSSIYD